MAHGMKSLPNLQTEELLKNHSPNKECFVNEICLLTKYLEIKNYGVADLTILLLRYYYVLWCRRRKTKLKVTRLPDYQITKLHDSLSSFSFSLFRVH